MLESIEGLIDAREKEPVIIARVLAADGSVESGCSSSSPENREATDDERGGSGPSLVA